MNRFRRMVSITQENDVADRARHLLVQLHRQKLFTNGPSILCGVIRAVGWHRVEERVCENLEALDRRIV